MNLKDICKDRNEVHPEALAPCLRCEGQLPEVWRKMSLAEFVLNKMQEIRVRARAYGAEPELQVYPTNDGRMKYELYVKLPEE